MANEHDHRIWLRSVIHGGGSVHLRNHMELGSSRNLGARSELHFKVRPELGSFRNPRLESPPLQLAPDLGSFRNRRRESPSSHSAPNLGSFRKTADHRRNLGGFVSLCELLRRAGRVGTEPTNSFARSGLREEPPTTLKA